MTEFEENELANTLCSMHEGFEFNLNLKTIFYRKTFVIYALPSQAIASGLLDHIHILNEAVATYDAFSPSPCDYLKRHKELTGLSIY